MFFRIPGHFGPSLVALLPKCATQSIKDHAYGSALDNEAAGEFARRYMFVRESMDRFHAGWHFFNRLKNAGEKHHAVPASSLESYEAYVDFTLTNDDVHWNPQISQVMGKQGFVPNRVFKFDFINEIWPCFFFHKLGHVNSAPTISGINDHRIDELKAKYRDDTILYWGASSWQ